MTSDRRSSASLLSREAELITNESGGNRFRVSIANSTRRFMAGFYPESNADSIVSGVLPERLTDRNRVPVKEFARFLHDKVRSPKWEAAVLRMIVFSDRDQREYKKFYKDYEKRERIAMFPLNEVDNLYLVVPKFQHQLQDFLTFEKATSTYALVLLRSDR